MRSHKDQKDIQFPNGSTYVFSLFPPSLLCVKGIEPVSEGKVSNFKIDSFFSNEMKIGAHLRKSSDDSSQQFHVFENLQKVKGKLIFEIIPHSVWHHVPSFPQQRGMTLAMKHPQFSFCGETYSFWSVYLVKIDITSSAHQICISLSHWRTFSSM